MAISEFGFPVFVLLIACFLGPSLEEEMHLIPIGSHTVAGELGTELELTCNKPDGDDVVWVLPSGEQASNRTTNRISQVDSNLKIANISWNDTGTYMCHVINGHHNDTLVFKVFEMPSYYYEGIIILAINSALLVLFLVCLIVTTIRNRQKRKLEKSRRADFKKTLQAYS